MTRPTFLEMDLKALHHNLKRIQSFAPKSKIIAMVKSNAYGHGLRRVAKTLKNVDAFGVACLEEANIIRQAGIKTRIVLMAGFFSKEELPIMAKLKCDTVVHSHAQLKVLEQSKLSSPIHVWLKIDTGMHRLGFLPEEVLSAHQRLSNCKNVFKPINLITHFADADNKEKDATDKQIKLFHQLTRNLPGEKSLANSSAILNFPKTQADWIRPGIMLYGISPLAKKTGLDLGLKPVMTLKSAITVIHRYQKGSAIGYGGTWICPENMLVGLIVMGYGDGYPRIMQSGAPIYIRKNYCPLIGRVSMDNFAVDLRSCPNAKEGDEVILWGKHLPIEKVAKFSGTVSYEMLCHLTARVHNFE